jgi:hypothetical protein
LCEVQIDRLQETQRGLGRAYFPFFKLCHTDFVVLIPYLIIKCTNQRHETVYEPVVLVNLFIHSFIYSFIHSAVFLLTGP